MSCDMNMSRRSSTCCSVNLLIIFMAALPLTQNGAGRQPAAGDQDDAAAGRLRTSWSWNCTAPTTS